MMREQSILQTIGNTPLIEVEGVYAKLETMNPTGSIKDRMARYLVEKAEERGELKKGDTIIEATSGNTGIAFAFISALRGYRFIAVMPESMSIERRKMMKAFGAELVLTPAEEDVKGAIERYEILINEYAHAWLPKQFENPDNVEGHRIELGREIIEQTDGKVDVFVAGTGTGGTLIGVAKALKEKNPGVKIIAIEPSESAVMSGGKAGLHKIQGIGEGFITKISEENMDIIDEVIKVSSEEAIAMRQKLIKEHGVFVGISSGANMAGALRMKDKYGGNVVTVFPDRGERYLSGD